MSYVSSPCKLQSGIPHCCTSCQVTVNCETETKQKNKQTKHRHMKRKYMNESIQVRDYSQKNYFSVRMYHLE